MASRLEETVEVFGGELMGLASLHAIKLSDGVLRVGASGISSFCGALTSSAQHGSDLTDKVYSREHVSIIP